MPATHRVNTSLVFFAPSSLPILGDMSIVTTATTLEQRLNWVLSIPIFSVTGTRKRLKQVCSIE